MTVITGITGKTWMTGMAGMTRVIDIGLIRVALITRMTG